jgi:hypothetical protein
MENSDQIQKAWVVTADMGLGHQRAAYPLAYMAENGIMTAGDTAFTDHSEVRLWKSIRALYEFVSRSRQIPVAGNMLFGMMNNMMKIPTFYPLRDLSRPVFNNHILDYFIHRGLGRGMMAKIKTKKLPFISTFYAPTLVADYYNYNMVYSVICDADLNRVWVATKPRESNVIYFAPCGRVMRRLREYGVPDDRIFITGFPLPKENIGSSQMEILKPDLLGRLRRLDPKGKFISVFGPVVEKLLGPWIPGNNGIKPINVTFAIGGAGAQVEIGQQITLSLKQGVLDGNFRVNIVVGVNREIEHKMTDYLARIGLSPNVQPGISVICEDDKFSYLKRFNELLRTTDILWTKPSELSFYSALGIPIVMAPSLGAQEVKNRKWLMDKACALPQYTPSYAAEWLRDMINDGILAEKAFNGFIKNRKLGVYKIEEVLRTGTMQRQSHPLQR